MYGMILSIFITFFLVYLTFYIFFDTHINGYTRFGITFCLLGFTIFYIVKWMPYFWR